MLITIFSDAPKSSIKDHYLRSEVNKGAYKDDQG